MTVSRPQVLFVTSDRIGDCILSSGVIREIGRQVPGAAITVACGPTAVDLFRAAPGVVQVLPVRKKKASGHWLDLWRWAIGTRWAMVVDIRGSALAYGLRTRVRRVYNPSWENGDPKVRMVSRMMRANQDLVPEIWLDDRARAAARILIGSQADGPILALAPVSSVAGRTWPSDRWQALVERLVVEPRFDGWRFMMLGGPGDEAAAAGALAAAGRRGIDAVGKGDILASAAAIAGSDLFVGNDSGLMHVAAAAGTPTLGLFGPSEWWLKAPWGERGRIVVANPDRARPAPIEDLGVERVFQALIDLYDAYRPGVAP